MVQENGTATIIWIMKPEAIVPPVKQHPIQQLAARTDKGTAQVIEEAVDQLLDYDAHFIREVEKGLAQVERGEVLTHEEVGERLKALFASRHSLT